MKKILSLVAILLTTLAIVAQNNPVITYQAVVRDASNRLVTNKSVTVKVEVLTPSNTPMYTEAEDLFTNANGLLSMVIGDYNPAQFANINWTNAKFATTVTVTSTGYEVKDTIPVSAVPYAITANYADDVNPTGNTIQAIYSKIEADSTALGALINANAVNISTSNQAIIDSSAHIRANLADTAAAIRGDFPTVNNVTLTIQKNGTDVGSFTTNQSTASAVNITVPTNVSDLEGIDAYATLSKVQADSLALATGINNLSTKVQADSLALGTLIDNNKAAIADSSAHIRANLADTAAAIRGDFPTVNDVTLTIQKNGTDVGSFTTNQSTAGTVNITVPTNVSELEGIDAYATLSKVQADSLALATGINNLSTKVLADSLALATGINNLSTKVIADSLALGTLIDKNKTAIADSSTHIRANLADTATAIRGDFPTVNNATLTIKQGTNTLGTFTANQSANEEIIIPTPAEQAQANWSENDASQASYIQNKPTLASVATSGSYNDLSDKPAINDATLTIQKNGTDVGTFTANQSTAGTVNITVPTTVAELTDEDNYAKKAGNNPFSGNNTFSGANDFTSGSITVPNAITNLNTTLNNPCNQNAVNVCDLMAVYDSLNHRIQVLEAVLHAVMDNLSYPTVITSQPSDISASKATLRGEIVSSGITNISGRGFYYNTTGEPNFFNGTNIQVSGNEVGAFTYNLTDLSPNTTYYIRTYAIVSTNNNNGNIYYGDVVSFTTLAP